MNEKELKSKQYNSLKLSLSIGEVIFTIVFILVILLWGFSLRLETEIQKYIGNRYLILLTYIMVLGLIIKIIWLPAGFYGGYILEHKFGLSNQSVVGWIKENIKGVLLSILLITPLVLIFYYFLQNMGDLWWLPVAITLFLFTIVLAQLAPTLLMPLFYKFTPLENEKLIVKLKVMCNTVGFSIKGVFRFDMSKNTKKANAALTGIGSSKRVILADTLLDSFDDHEIESVFAHELGHYVHKHIFKLMGIGVILNFLGLYLTSIIYKSTLINFGFTHIDQISALPLLVLYLLLFGLITSPIQNFFSRLFENQADTYSFSVIGQSNSFISAMEKLALLNLGDKTPHPLVEAFFYSHPSISRRISRAQAFKPLTTS